jgi:hypothetical protein
VINQSLVVGDILFATSQDRCLYLGTEKCLQPKWLADHPGRWRYVKYIPQEAGLLVKTESEVGTVKAGSNVRKGGDNKNDVASGFSGQRPLASGRGDSATDTAASNRSEQVDESSAVGARRGAHK